MLLTQYDNRSKAQGCIVPLQLLCRVNNFQETSAQSFFCVTNLYGLQKGHFGESLDCLTLDSIQIVLYLYTHIETSV